MKHCPYCGKEYPDDVELCVMDRHRLLREGETEQPVTAEENLRYADVSLEERRFWEGATLRHLAVLMVRLQSIWFFFNALVQTTFFMRYFNVFVANPNFATPFMPGVNAETFWTFLRILMHVAAGFALLRYSEQILNWFIRDWVWRRVSDVA